MIQFITAVMMAVAVSTSAHASFDFYAIEEIFYQKTVLPQVSDLLDTWAWVGFESLPGYPADSHNLSRIRNRDGSWRIMVFSQQEGFAGGDYLAVRLFNLGMSGLNQGPTPVTYDQDGVTFPKMGYDGKNTMPLSDLTQQFTCRSLASNSRHLLCQVRLLVNNLEKYPTYSRFNGRVILYIGFQKKDNCSLDP